jgi:hypothetical protein
MLTQVQRSRSSQATSVAHRVRMLPSILLSLIAALISDASIPANASSVEMVKPTQLIIDLAFPRSKWTRRFWPRAGMIRFGTPATKLLQE